MANEYTPTVWRTGDVITAEKLNNIEEGIANAGGGESDFSTAEVTLQITSPRTDAVIIIPNVITSPMDAISNNLYNPTTAGTQQVITVPLYKGSLIINGMWGSEVTVTTSGNVQVMDSSFLITGDCAITIA